MCVESIGNCRHDIEHKSTMLACFSSWQSSSCESSSYLKTANSVVQDDQASIIWWTPRSQSWTTWLWGNLFDFLGIACADVFTALFPLFVFEHGQEHALVSCNRIWRSNFRNGGITIGPLGIEIRGGGNRALSHEYVNTLMFLFPSIRLLLLFDVISHATFVANDCFIQNYSLVFLFNIFLIVIHEFFSIIAEHW